jgi:DNA-binding winged helix-turn-helix (wHTH) protein/TolB-like protein/Tfp pilus assembly protein PilF
MARWDPSDEFVHIGRWRADPRADELRSGNETVKLEPLKMRLLLALAERPGEVLLTQELLDRVWGDVVVTSASVYQGIAQLRRTLGDGADEAHYIETVPRKGYRLVAEVRRQARDGVTTRPAELAPDEQLSGIAAPLPARGAGSAVGAIETVAALPGLPTRPEPAPSSPARRRWLVGAASLGVASVAGVVAWRERDVWLPVERPVRLAVLPFVDRTQGASEAALSQGIAIDVIRALERYPDVRVTAPESALAAGAGHAVADVARQLAVRYVLVGELVRATREVQVDVRLLAVPGDRLRWQRAFEQPATTLSTLADAIASAAATALGLPLVAQASPQGARQAYELYALGNHAWRPKTQEAFAQARGYYERGIEADPAYARNYVGLGWTWLGQATNGGGIDWDRAVARAAPLFDKALRLDPSSAEALTAQAVLRSASSRYDDARALLARALAISPGYAQAEHSLGVAEFEDGWPQRAALHFRRAAELNPLSLSPLDRLGLAYVTSGRMADADATYRKAVQVEPAHPNGYWGLGIEGYAEGALDQAVLHYREGLRRDARRPYLWEELSYLYLDLGAPELAAEAMGHAAALLPDASWPKVMASYGWLLRIDRGAPPPELALTAQAVPEDAYAIDVMMVRAMAALPVDEALLQRALDTLRSRDATLQPILWTVFQGFDPLIDLATIYAVLGQPEKGRPHLDMAEQQLDRYERQGNAWHALAFHRSRLLALRGHTNAALDALHAAVSGGCRRGWRLRLDPAFESLRASPRFAAELARIDAETARQRAALNL